jgi:hypothetical protein
MPLRYEPPADPLTPKKTASSAGSYVIESDALQRLTKEIERYGRRELAGRSILIAGHRGIGKTTLVRKAIENARNRIAYTGRPLFVDLHGPDLLAPPDKKVTVNTENRASGKPENPVPGEAEKEEAKLANREEGKEQTPAAATGEGSHTSEIPKKTQGEAGIAENDSSKQPSGADLQSFVERLTFSLYRAAVKEFVECFREHIQFWGQQWNRPDELAEQFAVELDGSTDLGRIRLLYERAGALEKGVLKTSNGQTGSQELTLLAASSQAYRIVSGKLDEDQTNTKKGTNTVSWSMAADNLLSPVTGVVTGSLAWAALPSGIGPLAKLFTSLAAGLASAIAVKFTRTVQRESQQSSKVVFVPERNKLALRRLLPVLVDRFCDIGIPPIFVVDELDKVENISQRMESLMGFLKQFVTERAFFCFLVDRDYYEKLEATVSTAAFPKEATLFGDRLFVQYTPEAAHAYLRSVTKLGTPRGSETQDDLGRDLEVLPYVLLRRCYMHPFDLRREISRATNAQNEFRFAPRALFNVQQYRNEVYYQVAVECVLAEEKLRDFAEDPNRAQFLYDTLYFPIRTRKPEEFDASAKILKKHLTDRMGTENGKLLSEEDLKILHYGLSALVRFLCNPRELLVIMQALAVAKYLPEPKVFPQGVVSVIEAAAGPKLSASAPPEKGDQSAEVPGVADDEASAAPLPTAPGSAPPPPISQAKAAPLLLKIGAEKYRWQFDKYGYPVAPILIKGKGTVQLRGVSAGVSAGRATVSVVLPFAPILNDFEEAVKLLGTKHGTAIDIELWEKMRLVPTPPTWSYLREAADALRNAPSLAETKVEEYTKALLEYRTNLQSSLQTILSAVTIAATIAVHSRSISVLSERASLEILAEALAEAPSREHMLQQLGKIAKDMSSTYPLLPEAFQKNPSYRVMLRAIETAANAMRTPAIPPSEVNLQAGNFYENWFIQFYEGRRPKIDALWPFLSFAMGSRPFGLSRIDPLRMTIEEWIRAKRQQQNLRQRVVSMERLGFRRWADDVLKTEKGDDLLRAIQRSIQMRGYEKAAVILQPLKQSLSQAWLPSENIACEMGTPEMSPTLKPKYILIEIDERLETEFNEEGPSVRALGKIAFSARPIYP